MFDYKVCIEGVDGCSGVGYSKKESQQLASKLTLEKLRKEPKFIDEVFAVKASRTKMEEEPVEDVPSTEVSDGFIIKQDIEEPEDEKRVTAFKEEVFEDTSSKKSRRSPMYRSDNEVKDTEVAKPKGSDTENEEFDLSDISSSPQSRDRIIEEAESAAFSE
jgi:ribonuclease-3